MRSAERRVPKRASRSDWSKERRCTSCSRRRTDSRCRQLLERLLPGAAHLQNSHPLFVHFPIALLSASVAFYVLAWIFKSDRLAVVAFATLLAGTAGGAVAIGTGLYANEGVMVARSVRSAILDEHKALMLTTGGIAVVLSIWSLIQRPFPRRARPLFVVLLFLMFAVMLKGADDGGRMVNDYNAGGNACGQPIEFTK